MIPTQDLVLDLIYTYCCRQTSICWKRREDLPAPLASATSTLSLASVATRGSGGGGTPRGSLGGGGAHNECLCVEIFGSNCLGFHNTPNTLLHEIVTKLQELEVVESVSSGIASVISDYTANMPPVLDTGSTLRKVVRLVGTDILMYTAKFCDTFIRCAGGAAVARGRVQREDHDRGDRGAGGVRLQAQHAHQHRPGHQGLLLHQGPGGTIRLLQGDYYLQSSIDLIIILML